jgi:oligoribonuclease
MEWLLWLDLETTGLDVISCKILQCASVLTDFRLDIRQVNNECTIWCDDATLDKMDDWCKEHHTKSGLIDEVKKSKLTVQDIESDILFCLNYQVALRDTIYLAGNSVHFHKRFIEKFMPTLNFRLSHMVLDVSSLAIVCRQLNPNVYSDKPPKTYNHTSMSDILETIDEYAFYVQKYFRN